MSIQENVFHITPLRCETYCTVATTYRTKQQAKTIMNDWMIWLSSSVCLLLSTLSHGLRGGEKMIPFCFIFVLRQTRNPPPGYDRIHVYTNPWIYFKTLTNDKNMNISTCLLRLPYRFPEAMMPLPRLATQAQSILREIPGERDASRKCSFARDVVFTGRGSERAWSLH